jgi:hypothetical protein
MTIEPLADPSGPLATRSGRSDAVVRPSESKARPRAHGKFLFAGEEKLHIRGVTYGPFAPDACGDMFPEMQVVEQDFAQMAANRINAVRVFTPPPRQVLDAAHICLRPTNGTPEEPMSTSGSSGSPLAIGVPSLHSRPFERHSQRLLSRPISTGRPSP